jgi:hypothetical protein
MLSSENLLNILLTILLPILLPSDDPTPNDIPSIIESLIFEAGCLEDCLGGGCVFFLYIDEEDIYY